MQNSTDPADRTGTIGVEAFDATYGAGFQASDDSPHAIECELVEDDGHSWRTGRPTRTAPAASPSSTAPYAPRRGWTHTGADGDVSMGLAGSCAAGAVLVDRDEPARFDRVTTGRAAIFTAGPSGCLTTATAGGGSRTRSTGPTVEAARQQLQRLMRDAEADIAEALSSEGWLTVLDGPQIRSGPLGQ